MGQETDGELLRRFTAEGAPRAFEAIVRRHGPIVLSVGRSVLGGDSAGIEDLFQATFLVHDRNARTIRNAEVLGRWLHGVAYRIAIRARRQALRVRVDRTDCLDQLADHPAVGRDADRWGTTAGRSMRAARSHPGLAAVGEPARCGSDGEVE